MPPRAEWTGAPARSLFAVLDPIARVMLRDVVDSMELL